MGAHTLNPQTGTRREIKRRFVHFLRTFQDEQEKFVYKDRVKRMCDANKQSLEVATLSSSLLSLQVPEGP